MWVESMNNSTIFYNFSITHVSGIIRKAMCYTFTINPISLNMHHTFLKRFTIRVYMIMTPVKVYAMLAVYIYFTLYCISVFPYTKIHIGCISV